MPEHQDIIKARMLFLLCHRPSFLLVQKEVARNRWNLPPRILLFGQLYFCGLPPLTLRGSKQCCHREPWLIVTPATQLSWFPRHLVAQLHADAHTSSSQTIMLFPTSSRCWTIWTFPHCKQNIIYQKSLNFSPVHCADVVKTKGYLGRNVHPKC